LSFSFRLRHHRSSVVTADIEKSAQNAVVTSDDENWLPGQFASNVLAWLANLLGAPDYLPRARENSAKF
jgi:hypothetical protein